MQAQLAYDINLAEELCDFTYFGAPVYRKSFHVNNMSNLLTVPLGIVNFKQMIKIDAINNSTNGSSQRILPYSVGAPYYASVKIYNGSLYFETNDSASWPEAYVTVYYTKQ